MSTFDDLFNTYNGKTNVGNTTENKGQCVGLTAEYVDLLGLPHIWGDACDLFINADEKFFDKILNTPDAQIQTGDIVVWSAKFNGTVGHTGVASKSIDLNTFECFEQNDPTGSACHLKKYNYLFVIGWLRPKLPPAGCSPIILSQSSAFVDLCKKLNVPANKDLALAEIDKLITIEDQAPAKDKQLQDAQTQIVQFQNQLLALQSKHDDLTAQSSLQAKTIQDQDLQIKTLHISVQALKDQLDEPVKSGWSTIWSGILKVIQGK